jgi:hypothetical protein
MAVGYYLMYCDNASIGQPREPTSPNVASFENVLESFGGEAATVARNPKLPWRGCECVDQMSIHYMHYRFNATAGHGDAITHARHSLGCRGWL